MQIQETNLKFGQLKNRSLTKRIILHHSASGDVPASEIHRWHLGQGWSGLGYHFVIRQNGTIERGRPENTIGAHSGAAGNADSIGVVLAGNFEAGKPTEAQINSLVWLIKYIQSKYGELGIIGHRDVVATACPGRNFDLDRLRNLAYGGSSMDKKDRTPCTIDIKGQKFVGYLQGGKSYFGEGVAVTDVVEAVNAAVEWQADSLTVKIS